MTDFASIKTNAMALMNDPNRTWGRSFNQTLSHTVGAALAIATQDSPLASADLERMRSEIVQSLRTPKGI